MQFRAAGWLCREKPAVWSAKESEREDVHLQSCRRNPSTRASVLDVRSLLNNAMGTIRLKTSIPGPKSQALRERREAAVPRGLSHATPVYVARAQEAWIEDVDGNRFLDFAGGIGSINTGHRNPQVIRAIAAQLEAHLHTCAQVTPYENYVRLAERLNHITPG